MAESSPGLYCEDCKQDERNVVAEGLCKDCKQLYCPSCITFHEKCTASKDHVIVQFKTGKIKCDICANAESKTTVLCMECCQFYCDMCRKRHQRLKTTQNHVLHLINNSGITSVVSATESVCLSSDFEGFSNTPNDEFLAAQAAIDSSLYEINPPKNIIMSKEEIDGISAEILCDFTAANVFDEYTCSLVGITHLDDGNIVVLNSGNAKLYVFNDAFRLVCVKQVEPISRGMTKITGCDVAIVAKKRVHFYTIADMVKRQDKTFTLDSNGSGIAYNGKIYAIACDIFTDSPFIQILSLNGEKLNRIVPRTTPRDVINLDSQEDSLYVSAYYADHNFTCLTSQGRVKWEAGFCGGDVVELHNCILVTSMPHHAIYLMTKDGSYSRKLIQSINDLSSPMCIAYNPNKKQLYLTHGCGIGKRTAVTVIQLYFS